MNLLTKLLYTVPEPEPPKQPLPRSRIEDLAAAKIQWKADVARLLTEPMSATALANIWGTSRMTAYHRLTVMEKENYVSRNGVGKNTIWQKT